MAFTQGHQANKQGQRSGSGLAESASGPSASLLWGNSHSMTVRRQGWVLVASGGVTPAPCLGQRQNKPKAAGEAEGHCHSHTLLLKKEEAPGGGHSLGTGKEVASGEWASSSTEMQPEAQRGEGTCPRSHSLHEAGVPQCTRRWILPGAMAPAGPLTLSALFPAGLWRVG